MGNVHIVASRAPNGATLLCNILIELGVRPEWPHRKFGAGGGEWFFVDRPEGAYYFLNCFREGARFKDRDCSNFRTPYHVMPFDIPAEDRFVLVTRDPRDALWSTFMRATKAADYHGNRLAQLQAFNQFLHWQDFDIPCPIKYENLIWHAIWLAHAEERGNVHICRFEDLKTGLRPTRDVCALLGLDPTDDEIANALKLSGHEIAAPMAFETGVMRKGQPDEWRGYFTQILHDMIGPAIDPMCRWLGYPTYAEARASAPNGDGAAWIERYTAPYAKPGRPPIQMPKRTRDAIAAVIDPGALSDLAG